MLADMPGSEQVVSPADGSQLRAVPEQRLASRWLLILQAHPALLVR